MPITVEEIENRFSYHRPTEDQLPKYEKIRDKGKEMALLLIKLCPDSRELSTALTKLDEVVMHSNAAIARRS